MGWQTIRPYVDIPLTKEDEESLCRNSPHREGHAWFQACPCCGKTEWVSSNLEKEPGASLQMGNRICMKCQEVSYRNPEVFNWVLNVLSWRDFIQSKMEKIETPVTHRS